MATQQGPAINPESGCQSCQGCIWLRVHDFHYFYCRDLGNKSKPDLSPFDGSMKRILTYPTPHQECRFI